jgi:hypothetical protein
VLLGAKTEGVYVDTGIRGTGVVLERLDGIEVGTLTLGEAVLTVKLELSGDYRVLTPAVHVKSGLGKDEGTGIGKTLKVSSTLGGGVIVSTLGSHVSDINTTVSGNGVGKRVDGISVVERLGSVGLEKSLTSNKGVAVINVSIRLYDPDQLLAWVVEVELDLVGGRTYGLITSELDLLDEVLVGVLCHLSALIGIKEDIVNVERSGNKRLLVGTTDRQVTGTSKSAYSV